MSLPVELRPLASSEVRQIHVEFEAPTPGLGDRFLDRLQETLGRVEARSEMYAQVWGTVRAARLRIFRHVVYYVVLTDRVEVIAVIHGSRDSSSWQSRL